MKTLIAFRRWALDKWSDIGVALLLVTAIAYTTNLRRHIVKESDQYSVAIGDRAACFPYVDAITRNDLSYCSDSMSFCEERHRKASKDPDYESVGTCRVVSARYEDRDFYETSLLVTKGLGLLFAAVLLFRALTR